MALLTTPTRNKALIAGLIDPITLLRNKQVACQTPDLKPPTVDGRTRANHYLPGNSL